MANIVLPEISKLSQLGQNSTMLVEQSGTIYRHDTDYIKVDITLTDITYEEDGIDFHTSGTGIISHSAAEIEAIKQSGKIPMVVCNNEMILQPIIGKSSTQFYCMSPLGMNLSNYFIFSLDGKSVSMKGYYQVSSMLFSDTGLTWQQTEWGGQYVGYVNPDQQDFINFAYWWSHEVPVRYYCPEDYEIYQHSCYCWYEDQDRWGNTNYQWGLTFASPAWYWGYDLYSYTFYVDLWNDGKIQMWYEGC